MKYKELQEEIAKPAYDGKTPAEIVEALNAEDIKPEPVDPDAAPADVSRATQLGLGRVKEGHVQRAMGLETMAAKKARRKERDAALAKGKRERGEELTAKESLVLARKEARDAE